MQVYSISSDFYILPPGHWTCSFVRLLISTESIQSCSHFGALNLSYTVPSLSYQVLIFTWFKWSIFGFNALPRDITSKQGPNIERGETWYFSENPAPSGIRNRTAGSDNAKLRALYLLLFDMVMIVLRRLYIIPMRSPPTNLKLSIYAWVTNLFYIIVTKKPCWFYRLERVYVCYVGLHVPLLE